MKNIWTGKRERKFSAAPLLIFGIGAVFTLIALSNSRSANEELRQSKLEKEYPFCHCGARMDLEVTNDS